MQIKETLHWRIDFSVDTIVECFQVLDTADDDNNNNGSGSSRSSKKDTVAHQEMREILATENGPGKIYVRGYDHEGRALMYMTPARENTNHMINNMRHLVYNLEKAIACTRRTSSVAALHSAANDATTGGGCCRRRRRCPLEKINLLIDYEGFQLINAPPMSTTRYTLDILQKHYPERMRHAYLLHPPLVFRAFWALISAFVDPVTKEKIVFCSGKQGQQKLTNNVTAVDKLERRAYGTCDPPPREFDSNEYLHLPFDVSFDE
jgi:CRAL/TRIO domain